VEALLTNVEMKIASADEMKASPMSRASWNAGGPWVSSFIKSQLPKYLGIWWKKMHNRQLKQTHKQKPKPATNETPLDTYSDQ
jgi:hypothetical protein